MSAKYEFTKDQLLKMDLVHSGQGPRGMFEFVHGAPPKNTEEVEDLAIAFYSQFNSLVRYKF